MSHQNLKRSPQTLKRSLQTLKMNLQTLKKNPLNYQMTLLSLSYLTRKNLLLTNYHLSHCQSEYLILNPLELSIPQTNCLLSH
mmetsp:Transcript_21783/g.33665  ORF Transcript_21783/g.33665 Transcript_21783/m.33665 type:complete len:83 (-) Transcript_21783:1487-1735(-)